MTDIFIFLKNFTIKKSKKFTKFFLIGVSAAFINLLLVYVLIELFGFDTFVFRNLVNIVAMLFSTTYAFMLNRRWTWYSIPKKSGNKLIMQYLLYIFISSFSILIRIVLFAILDFIGLYHLINVTFGIGIASVFNYLMYNKYVFRRGTNYECKIL